jgi:hypothetical protein
MKVSSTNHAALLISSSSDLWHVDWSHLFLLSADVLVAAKDGDQGEHAVRQEPIQSPDAGRPSRRYARVLLPCRVSLCSRESQRWSVD